MINPIRRQILSVLAVIFLVMAPSASLAEQEIPDNPSAEQAKEDKTDYEFGGQILTLTEPKKDVKPSSDNPRFQDNKNGTVTDLETKLVWEQIDSYQSRKQWINWHK
ncbi:MAG: hypothetical protein OEZ27_00745, partial [Nitrospinota bacterium]|nr:hypothetical protein [Nitrospinota bacterium]